MKVSLRVLLSFALILLTAFPVVMLGLWAQKTTLEREYSRVQDRHLLLAKNITLALNRYAVDIKSAFRLLSSIDDNQEIQQNVITLAKDLHFASFRLERTNQDVISSYVFREGDSSDVPQDIIRASWEKGVGPEIIVHPVTLNRKGEPKIYLSRQVNGDQLAIASVCLDYFIEIQSQIKFGDSGHSAIVDQVGNLIAHPRDDWVAENKNLSHLTPIKSMVSGDSGVQEFFSPATQEDMITGYSVVPGVGWGVMIPQALSDLKADANGILQQLWSVLVIAIGLTALFAWWLAGWLMSPLKKIMNTAQRMNEGELSARVLPFVNVPSDEFMELGVAFDQMAQSLQNNNARLQIRLETQKLEEQQNIDQNQDRKKILVVDDTAVKVLKITGWLSKAGYVTFSALTNEESLKIASVLQPDLAIVGVISSTDGGFQNKQKLINLLDGVGIPSIAVVPEYMQESKIEEANLGAVATARQPLTEKKLLELINGIYQAGSWELLDVKFVQQTK